ncbi:dihydropteroate synthase [Corynebacterium tapiri]|uniref:Dihydropteroate synthase n=1 Tax=Corynebacterium tapiri TaxID=1448266 RepID=A0A5C4U263_9CORY|nr:dihydropteroate synthase [Corynebacterium tapiri]TNL96037.1 dihydropteroate synthase [Corynebacterium tapiri]
MVLSLETSGRCQIMGIVNVTEDSFSDGGKWLATDAAIAHAHELVDAGADIIDVGGESTRPGATRVAAEDEIARVVPVVKALASEGIAVSVDTMRAATARAVADAGAQMLNDVSGGLADPDMFQAMADTGLAVCLMHWRTVNGQDFAEASGSADHGGDVVADVRRVLADCASKAVDAGVDPSRIVFDPGLGFAKTPEENWQLLHALPELVAEGTPILVGASRKRFLAGIRRERGLNPTPQDADPATAAVTALSAAAGAWAVRVHEVATNRDAVDVAAAWNGGKRG